MRSRLSLCVATALVAMLALPLSAKPRAAGQGAPAAQAPAAPRGQGAATAPAAPGAPRAPRHEDTEFYEPVPRIVTPNATIGAPPSDAIVLFDGTNLNEWVNQRDKSPASWTLADGILTVNKQAGNIETKRTFKNYQAHLEWRIPVNITGSDQARGNSGFFLASTGNGDSGYELQILDSYENKTYVNGQAASVYKQSVPMVNASRKPGEWQAYDVIWEAPVFNADGSLKTPACITAFHNGVLVQNHFQLIGETVYVGQPTYVGKAYDRAPIKLQAHGDPSPVISFRNIWVREF